MIKRKITNLKDIEFIPFDNYGAIVPGMSWHKISYSRENGGQGTYVLKMEPGAKSLPHEHMGFEEFLMLDGELTDPDGKIPQSLYAYVVNFLHLVPSLKDRFHYHHFLYYN